MHSILFEGLETRRVEEIPGMLGENVRCSISVYSYSLLCCTMMKNDFQVMVCGLAIQQQIVSFTFTTTPELNKPCWHLGWAERVDTSTYFKLLVFCSLLIILGK